MSDAIQAYPLQWPIAWRRTRAHERTRAKFSKGVPFYRDKWEDGRIVGKERCRDRQVELSMSDATARVLDELQAMGMDRDDVVISTNVELRLDGLPKSNRRAPDDPGVAVYWRKFKTRNGGGTETRCMAIDRYDRVEDNLAAVAATLNAMRAIERHGGAAILDRAFQGFAALPAPESWWQVLKLSGPNATEAEIRSAHRKLIHDNHPDTGGDTDKAARINRARDQGLEAQQ
jgi:hypothetical protein